MDSVARMVTKYILSMRNSGCTIIYLFINKMLCIEIDLNVTLSVCRLSMMLTCFAYKETVFIEIRFFFFCEQKKKNIYFGRRGNHV